VPFAEIIDWHGYLKRTEDVVNFSCSPLMKLHPGRGVVLGCEMQLESAGADPIAARLLTNLLRYLTDYRNDGTRHRN
jgi:hypothetical protein